MLAVKGIFQNGGITLQEKVKSSKPVPVLITFLEEVETPKEKLDLTKFSFQKAREISKKGKGTVSNLIIEERRKEL